MLVAVVQLTKADEVLRSVKAIRELSAEEAGKKLPVDVEVQITKLKVTYAGAFVHDGELGIYLAIQNSRGARHISGRGAVVRVQGTTRSGLFLPHIDVDKIEEIGRRPLPKPVPIAENGFLNPALDCQWVSFTGSILGMEKVSNDSKLGVVVQTGSQVNRVLLPSEEGYEESIKELLHRPVRVKAVAVTRANADRQMTARYFQASVISDFESLEIKQPTLSSIGNLMQKGSSLFDPVVVRGTVLHSFGRQIYMRGEDGCILAREANAVNYSVGDVVEVTGFVKPESFRPILLATESKKIAEEEEPQPIAFSLEETLFPMSFQHDLVQFEANLTSVNRADGETIFHCSEGKHFFKVRYRGGGKTPSNVLPGARLKISGLCELTMSHFFLNKLGETDGFYIDLRSLDDVEVVKEAEWWTLQRVLAGLAILLGVMTLFLIWNMLLRAKVARQTEIISHQVQRQTLLDERHRLARELHDTLQQNMSGVALQLFNVQERLTDTTSSEYRSLGLARKMLDHCREDARSSIAELRGGGVGQGDVSLAGMLDDMLYEEAALAGVELKIDTVGDPRAVTADESRHALRIVQEAFTNALRHAKAKKVGVTFYYSGEDLQIIIEDDWCGFDTDKNPPRGHFGLVGMKERSERIGADFRIESCEGYGTEVILRIPA